MNETQRDFVRQSYRLLLGQLGTIYPEPVTAALALAGTAQAMLETARGTSKGYHEHNNFLGIKPTAHQPAAGPIRIFRDLDDCALSWVYLVTQSPLYERPRVDLYRAVAAARANDAREMREALDAWLERFCAIYCPDADYSEKVKALMDECYPILTGDFAATPIEEIPFQDLITQLLAMAERSGIWAAEIKRRTTAFHKESETPEDPKPTS